MKKITIAIDGYSSCGKSTMAKDLARQIGYIYIDSGAMYRSVTLYCLDNGLFDGQEIRTEALKEALPSLRISFKLDPETKKPVTFLNGKEVESRIRSLEVSNHVSQVAALPFVREELVRQQQAMGREKGIVMDGRDIQTVVFPDAELKIFVVASAEVRAQRRYEELKAKGLWAYACDMNGDLYSKTDMSGPAVIVIGEEGRGISRLVREKCDFTLSIPMLGRINSLNASNAAAILMYEIRRQRDKSYE